MTPTLKAPGSKRSKLKDDKLLSNFALNFNLRRYTMAMCQDTDYAVRICMCNQLAAISRAVGPDAAEKVRPARYCPPRHRHAF